VAPSVKGDLFELADQALYESKRGGRDEVRIAE
jgi:PleD family two-component response regulator